MDWAKMVESRHAGRCISWDTLVDSRGIMTNGLAYDDTFIASQHLGGADHSGSQFAQYQ